jgi:hypothetical protein
MTENKTIVVKNEGNNSKDLLTVDNFKFKNSTKVNLVM